MHTLHIIINNHHFETYPMNVSFFILCSAPIWPDYSIMKCLKRLNRSLFLRKHPFLMLMKQTKSYKQMNPFLKPSISFILNYSFFSSSSYTHFFTFCSQWVLACIQLPINSSKLKSFVNTKETKGSNYSYSIFIHSYSYFYEIDILRLLNSSRSRFILFQALNASNFSLLALSLAYSSICLAKIDSSFFVYGVDEDCELLMLLDYLLVDIDSYLSFIG